MALVATHWSKLGLLILLVCYLTSINYHEVQGLSIATKFKINLVNGKVPALIVAPIIPEEIPKAEIAPAPKPNPAWTEALQRSSQDDNRDPDNTALTASKVIPNLKNIVYHSPLWNWVKTPNLPSPTSLVKTATPYVLPPFKKAYGLWERFRGLVRPSESTPSVTQSQEAIPARPSHQRQASLSTGLTNGVSQLLKQPTNWEVLRELARAKPISMESPVSSYTTARDVHPYQGFLHKRLSAGKGGKRQPGGAFLHAQHDDYMNRKPRLIS
ncbi:hypothetical protein IWQ62_004245 [Dispira parvispora]|uniref:Uncharacterized protein n=1 Tax=Dispira parvispora TaxID=1520584 RepID=A0A9W8E5K9_9FUNG|nr:hypothetical protein IWQ62_004245 [Dispira parvispora]